MHLSTIVALFVAAAVAAPAPGAHYRGVRPHESTHHKSVHKSTHVTTHKTKTSKCSSKQKEACCSSANGAPALGLDCTLGLLGGTCSGSVQCCDADGSGGLIGLNLCVPIQP